MENFRLPAEWEAQWGVMLTWPHEDTDWKPYLAEITATYVAMAREIVRREWLLIVVPRVEIVPEEVRQMERVVVFECPTDDTWARDHGPVVLKAKTHPQPLPTGGEKGDILPDEYPKKCLWLDFRFNGWGEKFPADNDNRIVERLDEGIRMKDEGIKMKDEGIRKIINYQLSIVNCQLERHQDFVLEGGSIESDGRGTIFTTSQCLLAPNRNQPLTQAEIEAELKRRLRAERVVWLDHGNLVGDDTDGHIDTIVRCAPDDTLLYVGCDDENDEQFADFQALEQQLKSLRTAEGKPYRLLRLPMPEAIFEEEPPPNLPRLGEEKERRLDERLPATYANFLILNGAVLAPVYGQPENDAEALRVIGKAFPDRDIIPIDARTIIRQHGSVHCLTMQL